jgi:5-methylcytosine-specific restriction protein A
MAQRLPSFQPPNALKVLRPEVRENAHERGYNSAWQRARLGFLQQNPLCVTCAATGRVTAASVVDHIKPHKGDMALFWDSTNWQALCKPCHSRKTASKDGGFGNPTKQGQ